MVRVLTSTVAVLLTLPAGLAAQSLAGAAPTSASGAVVRVAYFSPQRAFAESAEGKAAQSRLTTFQADRERAVAEKNKALQAQQQALESSAAILSETVRLQRGKELERLKIEVQRDLEDADAELTYLQREIQAAFLAKLQPAIEEVAKEKGLQMVLNADQGTFVWADPSFDITAEVVKRIAQAK